MGVEKRSNDGIVTVIIAVAIFVGGVMWVVHGELLKIHSQMDAIDKRQAGLETAVRILSDTQSKPVIKDLIHDTLTVNERAQKAFPAPAMKGISDNSVADRGVRIYSVEEKPEPAKPKAPPSPAPTRERKP